MAEMLSKDLFSEFLWEQVGPWNWNWSCEEQETHKVKTHPSDVVFYYNEPYARVRTYVNCDLKSYARGSITAGSVHSAIESLARSISCAEKSTVWHDMYIHNHASPEICGLLFIYNHDGEYDRDFNKLLHGVRQQKLNIPSRSKIVVFGPHDIYWLNNVRYDIVQMRGTGTLPAKEHCRFFYPHLSLKKNVQLENAKAATLETLTAPWIILTCVDPKQLQKKGYVIFYRRPGSSVDEFLYLIDYLMSYQVLVNDTDVMIKILDPDPSAHSFFKKAIDQYGDLCDGGPELRDRLNSITFNQINQVQTKFSILEIGMNYG